MSNEVVADLGHRARPHLVALAQNRCDVGRQLVERRRLRDPPVAEVRDPPERGLARTADPDRRVRLLHRTRALPDIPDPLGGQRVLDRGERVVGDLAASLERHAERVELAFDVTGTDADDRAAVREAVERRELLGRDQRMLVAGDEHVGHQTRARRVRGEVAERRDRVVPLRRHHFGGFARDRDVMAHRDVKEPRVVGRLRDLHHAVGCGVLLPRHRDAHRERLHRELHPVPEHPVGNNADDGSTHDGHTTDCSSLYACRPNSPPSRPTPLNLVPPNGA